LPHWASIGQFPRRRDGSYRAASGIDGRPRVSHPSGPISSTGIDLQPSAKAGEKSMNALARYGEIAGDQYVREEGREIGQDATACPTPSRTT